MPPPPLHSTLLLPLSILSLFLYVPDQTHLFPFLFKFSSSLSLFLPLPVSLSSLQGSPSLSGSRPRCCLPSQSWLSPPLLASPLQLDPWLSCPHSQGKGLGSPNSWLPRAVAGTPLCLERGCNPRAKWVCCYWGLSSWHLQERCSRSFKEWHLQLPKPWKAGIEPGWWVPGKMLEGLGTVHPQVRKCSLDQMGQGWAAPVLAGEAALEVLGSGKGS